MKPLTREWVEKAEGDWVCVGREWRARRSPNYDALCFHAQQCVEKYLKACLQEAETPFEKTHNLVALLEQVLPFRPLWGSFRTPLNTLRLYAVAFRYPGETATREIAHDALSICKTFRLEARHVLGLASERKRT